MCKCVGCKNCEENASNVSLMSLADAAMVKTMQFSSSDKRSQARQGHSSPSAANKKRWAMNIYLISELPLLF